MPLYHYFCNYHGLKVSQYKAGVLNSMWEIKPPFYGIFSQ